MAGIRSCLAGPLIQRSDDLLTWWKARQVVHESLTEITKRRLCIVANYVPAERIFSKTGQIILEEEEQAETPKKVRLLVFPNANLT